MKLILQKNGFRFAENPASDGFLLNVAPCIISSASGIASAEAPMVAWETDQPVSFSAGPATLRGRVETRFGACLLESTFSGHDGFVEEQRVLIPQQDMNQVRFELSHDVAVGDGEDPKLVVPAMWYNDNNPDPEDIADYPKGFDRDWSLRLDGASVPGFVFGQKNKGFAVVLDNGLPGFDGRSSDDASSFGFCRGEENWRLFFSYPSLQAPLAFVDPISRTERHKRVTSPPEVYFTDFKSHEPVTFTLRYYLPEKVDASLYQEVCRREYQHHADEYRRHLNPWVSTQTAVKMSLNAVEEHHWVDGKGWVHHSSITGGLPEKAEIHSGWCGGTIAYYAAALLKKVGEQTGIDAAPRERFYHRALQQNDFIIKTGCDRNGFVNGAWIDFGKGGAWYPSCNFALTVDFEKENHIRAPLECCLFLLLGMREDDALSDVQRNEYIRFIKKCLSFIEARMDKSGAIPLAFDVQSGRGIQHWGMTQVGWAAVFILASEVTGGDDALHFKTCAEKIARHYGDNHVLKDDFCGGVPDAGRAINVEDGYIAMITYAELFRVTGDDTWLRYFEHAANYFCSWFFTYNVEFPENTPLAQFGLQSFGLPSNSVCNTFLCMWPFVAISYLHMLSDITGDSYYALRAEEFMIQGTQMIERGDGAVASQKGVQPEQWYMTNQNNFGGHKGECVKGDYWVDSVSYPRIGLLAAYLKILRDGGEITKTERKTKRTTL